MKKTDLIFSSSQPKHLDGALGEPSPDGSAHPQHHPALVVDLGTGQPVSIGYISEYDPQAVRYRKFTHQFLDKHKNLAWLHLSIFIYTMMKYMIA